MLNSGNRRGHLLSVAQTLTLWTLILCSSLFASLSAKELVEKPFVVLTTSYNNKQWVKKNIQSILAQDYTNYRVIYIDDCSTDGTAKLAEKLIRSSKKVAHFDLIRNQARIGALANIYSAVHSCHDDEILVSLDGDDWFYGNQVLKQLNTIYSSNDIWLSHGTFIEFPSASKAWSRPIPPSIVAKNAFREYRCPSHLRTFYAWLFKNIRLEDLQYEGEFFKMTWDQAMMFPMIEMAGERHAFITDFTYVYNMSNPINDNKVDPQLQRDLEAFIRSQPPYPRLPRRP